MAGADYYSILEVGRDASESEIKKAYRKLAAKFHPDRNKEPGAEDMFKKVSEAYQVLSDPEKKKIYDKYGEEGLKSDLPSGQPFNANFRDPRDLFSMFFGGLGGDDSGFGGMGGFGGPDPFNFGGFGGGFRRPRQAEKQPPIMQSLPCTLEELFHGTQKRFKITRKRFTPNRSALTNEETILTIDVKPGWKAGTKITFANEGDEGPGILPADMVFTIVEKPHATFKREKNDLVYRLDVPLVNALCGCKITVETLDGRQLKVPVTTVIPPGYRYHVPGEGMPVSRSPGMRGDLILEFAVIFPESVTPDQKQALQAVFKRQ
ncbi:DnaJ domain [Carpediemonas membranifera]|uniref:DnaJ domain n=1 Tax=Carpediemonas membranifera TaxID=201153 RepID=A0A8J6ARU6_9EUKA|nr:DnaJ domain [Carpediemonas membranifera]|eukprot:KAG9392413.1 DnaJ domain [Carpediemonas membranifera]